MPSSISKLHALIVAMLFLLPVGGALAADILVDADCSLRNAILSANEQDMVAPQADCEAGDADDGNSQVDDDGVEIPPGLDTIRIEVDGTVEGVITLDAALAVDSNIIIEGGGFTLEGAGNQIFTVTAGSLTVKDLTMNGGWTDGSGGAIAVANAALTLNNSAVSGSGAKVLGGGIYALDSDLALIDSVVNGNSTGALTKPLRADAQLCHVHEGDGAGVHLEEQCHTHDELGAQTVVLADAEASAQTEETITWDTSGGGIYFEGAENSLLIDKSGLDGNLSPANGGGLYIASGSASITNSTISSNSAGADGGGVYSAGESSLTHVTVVNNAAAHAGGVYDGSMMLLYNSILADNSGGDCSGTLNATIGNLIGDLSCAHDGLAGEPKLLLLGGSPAYYLPQEGSPALDAASPDYCLLEDQRGIDRSPESCDIGAAEHQPGVFEFQIQSALALLNPPAPGGAESNAAPAPTQKPSTCLSLPSNIKVTPSYGTQCKIADAAGVGNKTIVDYGFHLAVDIFGYVAGTVKTCFQYEDGSIILLDAANSPRNIVPMRSWREDHSMICADVDRVGMAVLVPTDFLTSGLIPEPIWDLSGCQATTTDIMNLRGEPNGASPILGNVLNDVTLSADQRSTHFHRVDYYGLVGWLSSSFLTLSGDCI